MKKIFFVASFLTVLFLSVNSCTQKTCTCGWYFNNVLIGNVEEQEMYESNCEKQSDRRKPETETDSLGVVHELPDDAARFICK